MQALRLRMQNKLNHDPTLSPQYRESIMKMLDYTIHEVLGEDFMWQKNDIKEDVPGIYHNRTTIGYVVLSGQEKQTG